jgi:hypothetical protein
VPKGPRLRERLNIRRKGNIWDAMNLPDVAWFDGLVGAIVGVIAVVVFAVIVATVLLPIVAFTIELVLFVVLFTAGLIGRLVFGRPWRIEAKTIGTPRLEREVYAKGLRGSREATDELAAEIAAGR